MGPTNPFRTISFKSRGDIMPLVAIILVFLSLTYVNIPFLRGLFYITETLVLIASAIGLLLALVKKKVSPTSTIPKF